MLQVLIVFSRVFLRAPAAHGQVLPETPPISAVRPAQLPAQFIAVPIPAVRTTAAILKTQSEALAAQPVPIGLRRDIAAAVLVRAGGATLALKVAALRVF